MNKKYLIDMLNNMYSHKINIISSNKTIYSINYKKINDTIPVFEELHEYKKIGLIKSLSLSTIDDYLQLNFHVDLGWEDGIKIND